MLRHLLLAVVCVVSVPILTCAQAFSTLTDGATITWPASSPNAMVTVGGNRTLLITGATNGWSGTLIVKQDATGGRTLALPSPSYVNNAGAGAIVLTSTTNAQDRLIVSFDGTNYYWDYDKNYTASGGGGGTTHTFTLVQKKNTSFNCSGSSCTISGLTSIGSGHVGVISVVYAGSAQVTISSITTDTSSWTVNPGTSECFNSGGLGTAMAFTGSTAGGNTSITVNLSASPTDWVIDFREYSFTPTGTALLDSATSTSTTYSNPVSGATPSISGSNDIIVQELAAEVSISSINSSYTDLETLGDNGFTDLLNTTSTTTPSWTLSGNSSACASQVSAK